MCDFISKLQLMNKQMDEAQSIPRPLHLRKVDILWIATLGFTSSRDVTVIMFCKNNNNKKKRSANSSFAILVLDQNWLQMMGAFPFASSNFGSRSPIHHTLKVKTERMCYIVQLGSLPSTHRYTVTSFIMRCFISW